MTNYYNYRNLRVLSSLSDGALSHGRTWLGDVDTVASLHVEIVPAIVLSDAIVPYDGHIPPLFGTVGVREGHSNGGKSEKEYLKDE